MLNDTLRNCARGVRIDRESANSYAALARTERHSDHRLRRGSPAPAADLLRKLLQRNQNASRASERRADPPPNRADWYPEITSDSRRTSSPIRPNVVFGTHRSLQIRNLTKCFLADDTVE